MAEPCNIAFGRYIKTLRERRALSLDDLCARSQSFAEILMKGYMSRVENGHQKLAFPKMIPLSRILEVPAEVLVERMELDLELDKFGGPDTEPVSVVEMLEQGDDAVRHGHRWTCYGFYRDASHRSREEKRPAKAFGSIEEQTAVALSRCAAAAGGLGRSRFSLFELEYVDGLGVLDGHHQAAHLRAWANTLLRLDRTEEARHKLAAAVALAESLDDKRISAAVFATKAQHATADGDWKTAIAYFTKAHDLFSKLGDTLDRARVLNSLGETYIRAGNLRAARRSAHAAQQALDGFPEGLQLAQSLALHGVIESKEGRYPAAMKHLRDASELARRLNDKFSRFRYDLELLKLADASENERTFRVVEKRLTKLAAWIPKDAPELREFRALRDRNEGGLANAGAAGGTPPRGLPTRDVTEPPRSELP